jgi:outer membrane protein TolC
MKQIFKHTVPLLFLVLYVLPANEAKAQRITSLDHILDSIDAINPSLKVYEAEIGSLDAAAKGARSWMAPEIGVGPFMTPYNSSYWKSKDGAPGNGQISISIQQIIPNPKRLNADYKYMSSLSRVERERKGSQLNQLIAEAKANYYEWIVYKKQLKILDDNEKLLNYMIQSSEIRYKNNLEKINAYYKAKAALGTVERMRVMVQNEIRQRQVAINTLLFRDKDIVFDIDTTFRYKDYSEISFDSTLLIQSRSDIKAIEREIDVNRLKIETERTRLLPEFGVRYENMYAWANQPQLFSLQGLVRIPIAPWSAKMNKANIQSLHRKNESLQLQKQSLINEAQGMGHRTRIEIINRNKQLKLYQEKIIPSLRMNFQTYQLAYEQNTENLFELFDAWESLNIMQLEYLNQLGELLSMQVELERILQVR